MTGGLSSQWLYFVPPTQDIRSGSCLISTKNILLSSQWDMRYCLKCHDGARYHSNHMTSSNLADTLVCHTTKRRDSIYFLYISGHMTLWCLKVVPVAYASNVIPRKIMSELLWQDIYVDQNVNQNIPLLTYTDLPRLNFHKCMSIKIPIHTWYFLIMIPTLEQNHSTLPHWTPPPPPNPCKFVLTGAWCGHISSYKGMM